LFFLFWWMLSFSCLSLSTVFDLVSFSFFDGCCRFDACLCQPFLTSIVSLFLKDIGV
jgi:hypothetical protein